MSVCLKSRHFILVVILGLGVLLLNACSRAPSIRPIAPNDVILAFGDSLTVGTGAEPDESYPAVLQRMLGHRVVNAGRPGERTGDGLSRLPVVVDSAKPALVILCHGGNDFLQRRGTGNIKSNLAEMIQFLQAKQIDVILVGVPQPTFFHRAAPLYRELAREYHLPYDGKILNEIISDRALKSDQIHPNAQGYQKLAEAIARLIRKSSAE